MNKSIFYSIGGILFSCIFIIFGFVFTKEFLSQNEKMLLSMSSTIKMTFKDPDTNEGPLKEIVQNPATTEEMVHILNVWQTQDNVTPHEPFNNHISMKQAVDIGEAWIKDLAQNNLIPLFSDTGKIDAFLCSNAPNPSALIDDTYIPPIIKEKLLPYLSYWTIRFSNEVLNSTLIINAVTGQVWRTDIEYQSKKNTNEPELNKALIMLKKQLALADEIGEIVVQTKQEVMHCFGNGKLFLSIKIENTPKTQKLKFNLFTK